MIGAFILWNLPGPTIHLSRQPSNVKYGYGDRHIVRVREARFGRVDIWAGTEGNIGSGFWDIEYGHSADIYITGSDRTVSKTNWTSDGVELVFTTGHRFFIPKTSFTGGR